MAKPRVFISSTYYDLKYVRSSLELFVESLGFEPVLSERGDVAYTHNRPLDESCYREVQSCDIYVLIIGGRYGSETSATKTKKKREFFERYESVTKGEYKTALDKDIPIYTLIERGVHSEYQTFLENRDNTNIKYAFVNSVNVYHFIEEILSLPKNNAVQPFDKYSEIEEWLRLQWAGLFRDYLQRRSDQKEILTLKAEVSKLVEANKTLQHFLEEIMSRVSPKSAVKIISAENERLFEAKRLIRLEEIAYGMLKHGERIECKVIGNLSEGKGFFAATNHRILAVLAGHKDDEKSGMIVKDSYTYAQINKILLHGDSISIVMPDETLKLTDLTKFDSSDDAEKFYKYVNDKMTPASRIYPRDIEIPNPKKKI